MLPPAYRLDDLLQQTRRGLKVALIVFCSLLEKLNPAYKQAPPPSNTFKSYLQHVCFCKCFSNLALLYTHVAFRQSCDYSP